MDTKENEFEKYKIMKRIEKIQELSLIYLKMATNKYKSSMAAKFRSDTEATALQEIVNEASIVKEELEKLEGGGI